MHLDPTGIEIEVADLQAERLTDAQSSKGKKTDEQHEQAVARIAAKLAKDIITAISKEMGYAMPEPAAVEEGASKKRKAKVAPNPVQAVLFSSLIVQ